MKTFLYLLFLSAGIPVLVRAGEATGLEGLIGVFAQILAALIPVLFTIALILFLWGLMRMIFSAGDERKLAEGKRTMVWGIVGLVVMSSIWGIIALLRSVLDLDWPLTPPQIQEFNG